MIKKIFHTADWHLRCYKRHEEFLESVELLIEEIKKEGLEYENGLICIAGDLFHQQDEISNEAILIMVKTLKKLIKLHKVLIIIGNHDVSQNREKIDNITPLVAAIDSENLIYSKKSEILKINQIYFVHYCFMDNFAAPLFKKDPNHFYVGLYHDIIQNAKIPFNDFFEKKTKKSRSMELFDGCDVVLMGDIHFPQCIEKNGLKAYYAGSLHQQNIGEPVNKHGFGIFDVATKKYEFRELQNSYGFYKIKIKNLTDFQNNLEEITNII